MTEVNFIRPQTRVEPSVRVSDPRFEYRNSSATDVTLTWAKARAEMAAAKAAANPRPASRRRSV